MVQIYVRIRVISVQGAFKRILGAYLGEFFSEA